MKIVIDEKIPYIKEALEAMGHSVVAKAGSDIDASDVKSPKHYSFVQEHSAMLRCSTAAV